MGINTELVAQMRANISTCPIRPPGSATVMSRASAKKMCESFQAATNKSGGVEYHSYPFCHSTCQGRDLAKNVTFNDDLIKEYQHKQKGGDMAKAIKHDICPDCKAKRSLIKSGGKVVCNSCALVRGVVKNYPEAVINIIKDVSPEMLKGSIPTGHVSESEMKRVQTLHKNASSQLETIKAARDDARKELADVKKEFSSLEKIYQTAVNEHAALREKVKSPSYIQPEWKMVYAGMEALLIHRSRTIHDLLDENAQLQKHSIIEESEAGRDAEVQREAIKALDYENQRLARENKELLYRVERAQNIAKSVMECNRKTQAKSDIAWCLLNGVSSGQVLDLSADNIKAIREAV